MYKDVVKRIIDILVSLIVLLLLWPLFIIIAILIKIEDHGSVFYKQIRTGINGNNFIMFKFRTMNVLPKEKEKSVIHDERVTKIGKFLRCTSLDELPQFINVIKGDMSFIGPRPWIVEYYERFNKKQKRRVSVRPGIIGLALVNDKGLSVFEKIEYDLKYIDNLTFSMDTKIFFKSIKMILKHEHYEVKQEDITKELEQLKAQ